MYVVTIAALVLGLVLLAVGYRRHHRNLLATSALLLLVAGAAPEFANGFREGLHSGRDATAEALAAPARAQ